MNYKIYDAGGDCAKKWYVYIIEKNSDGSTKQTKFYKGINTEPNKEARYKACNALIKKLCAGTVEVRNNTFAMEAELYLKRKQKEFKKRGLRNVTNSLDKFQLFLGDKKL